MGDFIYRLFAGNDSLILLNLILPLIQADSARNCDTLDEVRTDFKADLVESELFDDLHHQLIELIDARLSKCLRYEMWHANLGKIFARARFGTSFANI